MSDRIPKYTAELLVQLDEKVERVTVEDLSAGGWGAMTESRMRTLAFRAGMRAVVDELLEWQAEEEDDGEAPDDSPEPTGLDVQVLDPSGESHIGVASAYLAGAFAPKE